MLAALDLKAIAEISAGRMVDCLVEGTAVAIFGALLFRVARRYGSGIRFAILFSALVGVAVLPLLSGVWASAASGVPGLGTPGRAAVVVPGSWALYLFGAWALIAGFALLRVGFGLAQIWKLRRSCQIVNLDGLTPLVRETIQRGAKRAVVLCTSTKVLSPTAVGFLKPAVIIPEWLLIELSPAELNQVLLHELAHLRRWDDWTNLVQKIVKAVWFFHPLVWWIEHRISLEREMACDDAVLAQTENPRSYAECLALLAEKSLFRRSLAFAQAAVGKLRHTSLRVARILRRNPETRQPSAWKPIATLSTGLVGLCVVFVLTSPQLVAFQDNIVPPIQTATPGLPSVAALTPHAGALSSNAKSASVLPVSLKARQKEKAKATPLLFHPKPERDQPPILAIAQDDNKTAPVYMAKTNMAPHVATEAVFVVVENSVSGSPLQPEYQLCVWRVIVVRSNAPVTPAAPRKEI